MSMWYYNGGTRAQQGLPPAPIKKNLVQKYQHWPNPFKNAIKDMKVWACEDTWQAQVSLWTTAALAFFWSNFIPSPIEIERKFLTGSYKCGFYLFGDAPSVIDLVWGEPGAAEVLLEIASPAVKALFAVWAVETTFDALATYSSVLDVRAKCGADNYETLLKDAAAAMLPGIHNGAMVFAQVLWDPRHYAVAANNSVIINEQSNVHANAVGYIEAGTHSISSCVVKLMSGTEVLAETDVGPLGVGEVRQWHVEFAGLMQAGTVQPNCYWNVSAGGLTNPTMRCSRLTVRQVPGNTETPPVVRGPQKALPLWSPCKQVQEFYDSMS